MAKGVSACKKCGKTFDRCHEIPFSRNPLSVKNFKGISAQIQGIVAEGRYDIVHVHTPVASFVTRWALRKPHTDPAVSPPAPKVVYTAHGFHFHKGGNPVGNALFVALERAAGKWTDHTITINREDYDAALYHKIADAEHLSLLPGVGLDFSAYSPNAIQVSAIKKFHESLNLAKGDELFLMVAEFNSGKRHRDALHALAGTGRRNFHLAFAGTGPQENAMKKLASKLGVDSQTHFLGQRADVPLLMLSSRATLLPSEREGLNRSVMESICLGIPVLGADARGIRDLVTTPERGALFPVGRPAALAAAMILAVEEPCETKPTPDPLWKIERLLSEHEKLYRSLLARA
jgi:glycosyltransferase involved in cell wall biosynthesis